MEWVKKEVLFYHGIEYFFLHQGKKVTDSKKDFF